MDLPVRSTDGHNYPKQMSIRKHKGNKKVIFVLLVVSITPNFYDCETLMGYYNPPPLLIKNKSYDNLNFKDVS